MRIVRIVALSCVLACTPLSVLPQTQPALPEPMDSLLLRGIDLILQQRYSSASNYFLELSHQYRESPEGSVFQAAVLQTAAVDFRDFREKERFDSLLAVTKGIAEKMIEEKPDSPWGHYYLGTALGMESYDRIQRGGYISGYFKGRSAVSELQTALKMDSTFYDAYSVLGTYYYWKSRKTEIISWLPLFSDERAKGIQCLVIASEKGRYQQYAAMSNLVWIYLDAGENKKAEELACQALERYPTHRIFLHGLAGALLGQNKIGEALEAYQRQLIAILKDDSPNDYNEIGCRLNIVYTRIALRDTTTIREQLSAILDKQQYKFPSFLRTKVDEKFEQARRFQDELSRGTILPHGPH